MFVRLNNAGGSLRLRSLAERQHAKEVRTASGGYDNYADAGPG